jgi:hypothetical protein
MQLHGTLHAALRAAVLKLLVHINSADTTGQQTAPMTWLVAGMLS